MRLQDIFQSFIFVIGGTASFIWIEFNRYF